MNYPDSEENRSGRRQKGSQHTVPQQQPKLDEREQAAPPAPGNGSYDAQLLELERELGDTRGSPGRESTAFDPHVIWKQLLSEFALELQPDRLDAWIQESWIIHYEDGQFIVGLPNAFYLDWAESRLRPRIKRKLAVIMGRASVDVTFRVQPRPAADTRGTKPAPLYDTHPASGQAVPAPAVKVTPVSGAQGRRPTWGAPMNTKYTFESFVVGNHNRMAFAAAQAITEAPGQRFNPLYVYGGVGLGKTHLLNAIGNCLIEKDHRVIYCSAEQFANDLIEAIRDRTTDLFRGKYREADALLIDDIQFIAGKESTQEEFFHTFNHLHAAGKQIVISSDCPPRNLPHLEARLRSRFEGGLQTDIVAPDFETRVAILQTKASRQGLNVPAEVLMLIAERVSTNVREMEGALNNVWMQAATHNMPLTLSLVEGLLGNLAPRRAPCPPTQTLQLVADHFGFRVEELTGRRRTADIAQARHVAMYLLREENGLSLPAVGDYVGGRDHSTVSHGVEKIGKDLQRDEVLRQVVMSLRNRMYQP
ncbi:MAG: chromosomal replication initiator protein DnaA [Caldilineaceae bacterium]|nr:chromosomal replication initiator protein DnaA [Caldilineaceae bacterium]